MREKKFRAWDTENKIECEVLAIRWDVSGGIQVALPLLENVSGLRWLHISKVELKEFTGLKDKNGKEIFEGDIVKFKVYKDDEISRPTKEVTEKVTFKEGCFCAGKLKHFFYLDRDDIEVIGNIYENPELLENVK